MGNERMKNRFVRYVLIVLLCGMCHTVAFAYGYNNDAQSRGWGYQPLYSTSTPSATASAPTYQFRTTSIYAGSINESNRFSPGNSGPRRGSIFDDPGEDDDPTGVVPDPDPTPIGDAPWLFILLLAAGYIAFRALRQRKTV
jgi:hypothetical protein